MNIILKAFDGEYCKQILERTFRDRKLGTCISILENDEQLPKLNTEEHRMVLAKPLRTGQYSDVDWNAITPLDEEIIENMHHCEAVFMTMIERYGVTRTFTYQERKQQYFDHLRYWNHVLETEKIDLYLANHQPHQGYDFVIYNLCKLKGIRTLYLERCYIFDAFFVVEDWEKSAVELEAKLQELQKQFANEKTPVPLSGKYEAYFRNFTEKDEEPWYMQYREKKVRQPNFAAKWTGRTYRAFKKEPLRIAKFVLSTAVWKRKLEQHKISQIYDKYVRAPDLSVLYIYVPLHYQPEASTCPLAGVYTNQELIVQLLAWHLPEGVKIYVKEHPTQGELCRTAQFYDAMRSIPSVVFVPKTFSTFQLTEHALAVVTATGTAGVEALCRGKPVLMSCHRLCQYAPGVHRIHSAVDMKEALRHVLEEHEMPTQRGMRLFLKAMEECAAETYVGWPLDENAPHTKEEQAEKMGEYIDRKIFGS